MLRMTVAPQVDIAKVMAYAKEKGVRIMLYYDACFTAF